MKEMMMKKMLLGMKYLKVVSVVLLLTFTATHFSWAQEMRNDDILDFLPGILAASKLNTDYDRDGYTENQGDCSDLDANTYPGATEICGDGIDQDCNGIDLLCPDDIDNDGDGYTENQGDCSDLDAKTYPNATEICGDGIDQDCSGEDLICVSNEVPSAFSMEWLSGRTLYQVWFGGGDDAQGNAIDNVPVVVKIEFGANGIATATGLLNAIDLVGPYGVTASGGLYFADYNGDSNVITCNTSDYIATDFLANGQFDNVDLFFFDESTALDYANALTDSIVPDLICVSDEVPSAFSMEWLSGRTLYQVWFGGGDDAQGNAIDNVPVVVKIEFGANGIATATGLLNAIDLVGPYGVTASGGLYFADYDGDSNVITCNTADYIATDFLANGQLDNVDLFFFDESTALDYANALTDSIVPACSQSLSAPSDRFNGIYTSSIPGDDGINDKTFTHEYTVSNDAVAGSVDILHVNKVSGDSITATIRWVGTLIPQLNNPLIANISGTGTLTYPWIPETREFILYSDESIVICDENDNASCQLFWTSQNPFSGSGLGGEGTRSPQ